MISDSEDIRIIIDPRLKFNYASWILWGLQQLFEKKNISFDMGLFKKLPYRDTKDYNSGFAFIVIDRDLEHKVFVDTEDQAIVFPDRYDWCDVYAMVNPTSKQIQAYEKLMAIGPQCGITLSNIIGTIFTCLSNYRKGRAYASIPLRLYLRDYIYTNIRRRSIQKYFLEQPIRPNYVFHASTLWYNEFASTDTNRYRGEFLVACKKAGLQIEGGLFYIEGEAPVKEMPSYPEYKTRYKDFIYNTRLSMDDYIRKTKESVVVFNTPSVCECHGWKLAEYLCMGKAIISTLLTREMPGEGLIHGKNVHFVHTAEDIFEAVMKISSDKGYREKLEQGAREYYATWLAPEKVVTRILKKCDIEIK
jgi:hypothetical protein